MTQDQTNAAPSESSGVDEQPIVGRPIQYGVRLHHRHSTPSVHNLRWRKWDDAAEFGQIEVLEGRAIGFWIFREPSE